MAATNYLNPPAITGTANLGVAFSSNQSTQLVYPPTNVGVSGNTVGATQTLGGSIVFAGGPNITLSGATAANVMTLSISAGAGAGDGVNIIAAGGSTAATTGTIVFSNSNGVSFGLNGATITASHNGLTSQSNQAYSAANGSVAFQTLTFANSNGISFSTGTQGLYASHDGLTSQSNQAFSAQGGSSAFQTLSFANSNGLTFSNSNGSVVASYTVPSTAGLVSHINLSAGTTSNNSSAFTFANGNGVSFGLNAGTITGSHNGITSQSNQQISAFAQGNTTQSSSGTFNASSVQFRGEGIASVGVSNGSVVVSVPSGGGGLTNINLSAGTTSQNLSNFVLSNSNGVSFGLNGSTITASVNAGGGATISMWPIVQNSLGQTSMDKGATANPGGASTNTTVSYYVMPWALPEAIVFSQQRIMHSFGTAAGTGSYTFGNSLGVYTKNGDTLSLVTGWQNVLNVSQNSVTAQSIRSYFGTNSTSNSWSSAGNISASLTGHRGVVLGDSATTSLSAGQYYVLIGCSTQTGGANIVAGLSHAHISEVSQTLFVDVGQNAASTNVLYPYHGAISSTRSATDASVSFGVNMLPSSFNTSLISNSGTASARSLFFHMANTSRT